METAYIYLALSSALTLFLWTPYILARLFVWGLPTFLTGYPEGFPAKEPETPLWAKRAKRAHLNMVETMPAFVGTIVAANFLLEGNMEAGTTIGTLAMVFFWSRIVHAIVYIAAIPMARTPVYLVSWASILMIAYTALI